MSTRRGVHSKGNRPVNWYTDVGGLFADGPHVVVRENQWFEDDSASVERWWVIDESAAEPRMFGSTTWWHGTDLDDVMASVGLVIDGRFDDLSGATQHENSDFESIVFRPA